MEAVGIERSERITKAEPIGPVDRLDASLREREKLRMTSSFWPKQPGYSCYI